MIKKEHDAEKNLDIESSLTAEIHQASPNVYLNKLSHWPGKYEIFPTFDPSVSEIFQNKFDITWHEEFKIKNSSQRIWTTIKGEHSEDDGTVSYKYNSEYFISDEFTNTHNRLHVLFAGCSETEGQGGNIEDSWGNILFNTIKDYTDAEGFYNLGKAGYGWQKIINQVRIYINRYGKPDNLFILLPNIGRSIEWSDEYNSWYVKQAYPRFESNKILNSKKNLLAEMSEQEYKKVFIDFVISWRLFEDFCNAANIKLIWGTWEPVDDYNFTKLNLFNNFVPLPKSDLAMIIEKYRKDAKTSPGDLEKRDGHHGRLFHEYWADTMLEESKRRNFINDKKNN